MGVMIEPSIVDCRQPILSILWHHSDVWHAWGAPKQLYRREC